MNGLARIRAGNQKIECGLATTRRERAAVLAQRFRVYPGRGYYRPGLLHDRDEYDKAARYFLAVLNDGTGGAWLLGSARVILGEARLGFRFPAERAFEFNVAIRDGKTERNPVAKLKMLREPSGRVRYLSDEEEQALVGKLLADEGRDRLRVLLQAGLRKPEFLGLRWKDVDLKAGVLTIPRSKHGEARHVPLTSEVRAIISRRPRSLDASALIFPNSLGNTDLRLYDTRHTFASRLAMEGVDLLTIKEIGGWKTLSMVQRYAHLSPGHQRQAIERLVTRTVSAPRPAEATGRE